MKQISLCLGNLDDRIVYPDLSPMITGSIFLKIDNHCFPDEYWHDVVSSVLDMWTSAICDFIMFKKTNCSLYFMEGPYCIHLLREDNGVISAQLCGGRLWDGSLMSTFSPIDTNVFFISVLEVNKTFLSSDVVKCSLFSSSNCFSNINDRTKFLGNYLGIP